MNKIKTILSSLACILILSGCDISQFERFTDDEKDFDEVMIYCAVGRNDLHYFLKNNIEEIKEGYVPSLKSRKAIIILSDLLINGFYSEITCPYAIRLYSDSQGTPVMDTLKAWSHEDRMTSVTSLNDMLTYVKDNFNSANYGMVYSSHGTGWLPDGYYSIYGNDSGSESWTSFSPKRAAIPQRAYHYIEEERDNSLPLTKTLGKEVFKKGHTEYAYEMTTAEFAAALPFKLEYLVLDACFMGGIEVLYDLKDKCSYVVSSQAEILAAGFNYVNMANRLLNGMKPDLVGLCEDYYAKYKNETGSYQSATISATDCSALENLASVCKPLFSKYRTAIQGLDESGVQAYFVHEDKWFYDLEDMLVKAGISSSEQQALKAALQKCVLYKAGTKRILDKIDLKCFSGFSTYLPNQGTAYLNEYYKTLAWNNATGFVE